MNETSAIDHWAENFTLGMQIAVIIPGNFHCKNVTVNVKGTLQVFTKIAYEHIFMIISVTVSS